MRSPCDKCRTAVPTRVLVVYGTTNGSTAQIAGPWPAIRPRKG